MQVYPLSIDFTCLVDHKLPLTGEATQEYVRGYSKMPKPLVKALTGVRGKHARLHKTYRKAHGGIYLLQYDVPLGTGTSFLRVAVLGRHERHAFRSYCRVKSVAAYVLVFPAALCLAEQRALLDKLAATEVRKGLDGRGATVYKDVMADLDVMREWVQRIRAPGVLVVTVEAYNAAYRDTLRPTRPAYIELGATTGVEATPATIATLSSYGLAKVDVKPLDGTHVIHREEHLDKAKASWRPPRGVKLQPVVARWHLERYLHSPDRLAIVALTPTNRYLDPHERARDNTATSEEARVPVAGDVVVGGVLFRLHRFDARAKKKTRRRSSSSATATSSRRASSTASAAGMTNRPTSIELRALAVDYTFDEDARGLTGSPNASHDGIKYRLLAAAVQRARAVYGDHDIVYVGTNRTTRTALRTFGFKAVIASAAKGASAWWSNATRRLGFRAETAPLVYRAIALQCTTWEECLQLVRERYPEKSLKECMLKTKDFYTATSNANGRAGTTSRSSRKRSHRPVSANVGKALMLDFYNRKHLVPHGLDRRTTAFKQLFDPARDEDPSVKTARAHVRAFCTAVRHHLEHRRTTSEVLTAESGRTWLYRPDPKHPTRGGPDAYYLAELHKGSEPGATVYQFPLGRRCTPGVLGVEARGSG